VRDIDTAVVDSLKVLDPNRPIREADMRSAIGFPLSLMRAMGHPALWFSAPRQELVGKHVVRKH
jgi:hypothetical protein